jgi:putative DNA methylase
LTPKSLEIIDTLQLLRGVPKEKAIELGLQIKDSLFYENGMAKAFAEGRRLLHEDGIGCVVFAHKTTEGWEALLSGMIRGGWLITGSWPISTERPGRLRSQNSAALATSVHLICRPRSESAPVGDWAEVLNELPKRVGFWMERLHQEGVRGADMVFACIGPALEIYSKYSKVETAEGRVVELPEYLAKVWEVVGRKALENVLGTAEARARNGAAGALEEDARLTALFLWAMQSTALSENVDVETDEVDEDDEGEDKEEDINSKKKGGYSLIYDVVGRFSQPLGINLDKWEDRIIKTEKGIVRLLPVDERAKQLFGDEGAQAMADRIEEKPKGPIQMKLFADKGSAPDIKGRKRSKKGNEVSDEALKTRYEATTLDKVHAAMLLQANGRTNALRALIEAEQNRGSEFMRLANALSALYPPKSEEKRLLDAMILAAPR